jgi:biotin transport system substrate-specific component
MTEEWAVVTVTPDVLGTRLLGRSWAASATLVVAFALLTGLAAQWEIHLGFTPVPITGQTFAVLLSGAALGSRLGASSQLLYIGLGVVGLPFFAGGTSGIEVLTGATVGYLIGFVAAATVVGRLAERRADRRIRTSIPAFVAGSTIIYLCGMLGLIAVAEMGPAEAFTAGVAPFLVGDAIKAGLAGLLLPAAWKVTSR